MVGEVQLKLPGEMIVGKLGRAAARSQYISISLISRRKFDTQRAAHFLKSSCLYSSNGNTVQYNTIQ